MRMQNIGNRFSVETVFSIFVIAVCGILLLVFVLVPRSKVRSQMTAVYSNGNQIRLSMLAANDEKTFPPGRSGLIRWPDSSHFLAELIERNLLDVTYGFFAPPMEIKYYAKDYRQFVDGKFHNIWCVTLDLENTKSNVPAIFTQNFSFSSNTLSSCTGFNPKAPPWGDRGGVILLRDGGGYIVKNADEAIAIFKTATNMFLWPLGNRQFMAH